MNPPAPICPSRVREKLDAIGVHPSRKLGQNFLVDQNVLDRILRDAGPVDLPVLEIGPGLGQVSHRLLTAGYELYAVEFDHRLAAYLRKFLDSPRFHLTEADAVECPLGTLPPETEFQIIANLPYAITSPWLERILLKPEPLPQSLTLLVQLEAWQRLSSAEGSKARSALAVLFTAAYETVWTHRVTPGCFFPPPEVDSILVQVRRRKDRYRFDRTTVTLMRDLFQQRRKQIGKRISTRIGPETAARWFAGDSVACTECRPESLPNRSWIELDLLLRNS